jgi:hypothetical protein
MWAWAWACVWAWAYVGAWVCGVGCSAAVAKTTFAEGTVWLTIALTFVAMSGIDIAAKYTVRALFLMI